jgi:nitrogen fixation/metabolism regulation signal transduction histidine kinase
MDEATRAAFADAMLRALIGASGIAVVAAVVVSLAVAVRIARPVNAMAASAGRIAGGFVSACPPLTQMSGQLADSLMPAASLEDTSAAGCSWGRRDSRRP